MILLLKYLYKLSKEFKRIAWESKSARVIEYIYRDIHIDIDICMHIYIHWYSIFKRLHQSKSKFFKNYFKYQNYLKYL